MSRGNLGFNIRLDDADVKAILSELSHMPDKMKRAERDAIKKSMKSAQTSIKQRIGGTKGVTTLSAKTVGKRIRVKREPSTQRPQGIIEIRGARIPLWEFGGSRADLAGFQDQSGKRRGGFKGKRTEEKITAAGGKPGRKPAGGAGFKVYKSGQRTRRKWFFAHEDTNSGKPQIFHRTDRSKGGNNAIPGRDYRIAYGLSLVEIMRRKSLYVPTLNDIADVLEKNLRNQVDRFLKRSKKDRPNAR